MPISTRDAPDTLPAHAKEIYAAAFNAAYGDTCKNRSDRDACAAKIAWAGVKNKYRQAGDKWVPKAALVDVTLTITKASIQEDGTMRWQAVASDTDKDRTGEQTSLALFQDWVERVETGKSAAYLPPPRRPFLGLSHYPALDGFGEAGPTEQMYVDGKRFKAAGLFYGDQTHPLGKAIFEAVRRERELIQRGQVVPEPIRISAAWWDIAHSHGDFVFERKSLDDRCPMCEHPQGASGTGNGDKVYLKGQLDHFAATRVPINPRTSLALEEKAMVKRVEDAASIVDEKLAEELEERVRLVGKSETEEGEPEGLIVKAKKDMMVEDCPDDDEECKKRRKKMMDEKKMTLAPAHSAGVDEKATVEKMGEMAGEMHEEEYRPFGGAMSLEEADNYMRSQEMMGQAYSNWGMFQEVMSNILNGAEPGEMKARMQTAISEFGDRIGALKSAIEDAYLIQDATELKEVVRGEIMTTETKPTLETAMEALEAAIQADGTREAKLQAVQAAFNQLGEVVKAEIDAVAPPDPNAEINKAILEQLQLLNAKMAGPALPTVAAQLQAPQQKSFIPTGQMMKAAVEPPVSPHTGQPSALTAAIRRSVGIQ